MGALRYTTSDYSPKILARRGFVQGSDADRVRKLFSEDGRVWMRLRLKGMPPLPRVQAELCWGMGEKPHFTTGWRFTDIDSNTIQLIEVYVAEHQEDILEEDS